MSIKKLVPLIIIFTLPAFGSLATTTEWDIRTTGSDANGGGFNTSSTGTDRSQQDTAFTSYTDLVIGATTTQGTSVLHPFGATDVGNIVNEISGAGCTVQRRQVVSVSGITATFDATLGTAASVCTANLGGAMANLNSALVAMANSNAGGTGGGTYHVKAGTYTYTTTQGLQGQASNSGFTVIGYSATHRDGGTRPLITTATNSIFLFYLPSAGTAPIIFSNVNFSNTAATRAVGFNSNSSNTANPDVVFADCTFDGFSWAIDTDNTTTDHYQLGSLTLIRTEVKNGTVGGITTCLLNTNSSLNILDSWIHDNTGIDVLYVNDNSGTTVNIIGSIISAATSKGFSMSSTGIGWLNIIRSAVANNTGDGVFINVAQKDRGIILADSIFYGNGGWGINAAADATSKIQTALGYQCFNNAYGANTSGNLNNIAAGFGDKTLSANPFTSSTNFALNSTAGGGTLIKQAGSPGAFPGGTTTGYLDIGPVQTSGSPGTCASTFACGFSYNKIPELRTQ